MVLGEANQADGTRCLGYNGGTANGNKEVLEAGIMDVKDARKSSGGMDIVVVISTQSDPTGCKPIPCNGG